MPNKKVVPGDKVTPSEEVEKLTKALDYKDNTKFTDKLDLPVSNYLLRPNISKK